jgi:hypothetical protein
MLEQHAIEFIHHWSLVGYSAAMGESKKIGLDAAYKIHHKTIPLKENRLLALASVETLR